MKNLFIIPARSGSKGIKDKNIQTVNGIPLFVWSIIHARYLSSDGDYICVSSDSDKYLSIAKNWGADPIKRSKKLSEDNAFTEPVMEDAINQYDLDEEDNIFLLQPTSPLRSKKSLDKFINLINSNVDSGLSVKETYQFEWIKKNKNIYKPNYIERPRRQDMKPKYIENGSVYFTKLKYFRKYTNRVSVNSRLVIMDEFESIEIDNSEELELVKSLSVKFNQQWLKELTHNKNVKCIFSDIDGVFAKNNKKSNSNDRNYSTLDSAAISSWIGAGNLFFFVSSEKVKHSEELFNKMNVTEYMFGSNDKLTDIKYLLEKYKLKNDECAFLGNDTSDIKCLEYFNKSFAPDDANSKVFSSSKFMISKKGGDGFISEVLGLLK